MIASGLTIFVSAGILFGAGAGGVLQQTMWPITQHLRLRSMIANATQQQRQV